jgi:hypothetical protein
MLVEGQTLQVAFYIVVAAIVAVVAWQQSGSRAWTFLALSLALVVLAGLKAAGVQAEITHDGRSLSHQEGWYQSRRIAQGLVVSGLALVGIAPLVPGLGDRIPIIGRSPYRFTLSACCLFCAYILMRMVSLHYVDSVLYRTDVHGISVNSLVEMALVFTIGATAVLDGFVLHRPKRVSAPA